MAKPTLIINGFDVTELLSSMMVAKEITYKSVITTRDGVEKPQNQYIRTVINFAFLPLTPTQISQIFAKMKGIAVPVRYYDPYTNSLQTKVMRLSSDLEQIFLIDAIDGRRYYNGKTIQMRQNGVG